MSECATCDCPHAAAAEAWIAEAGPQGEGEWARYCAKCAEVLARSGDDVRWDADSPEQRLRDLLSSCKQWRQATESRLRLTGSRGEAVPLKPDQALFEAIDRAEGK